MVRAGQLVIQGLQRLFLKCKGIYQEPVHSIQLAIKGHERRFRLVAAELPEDMEKRIRARLTDLHPDLADYPIDLVDDVATNRAGKRRWIVYE